MAASDDTIEAAEQQLAENRRFIEQMAGGVGYTPQQLLQLLRTMPDDVISQPMEQIFAQVNKEAAASGDQGYAAKWGTIAIMCLKAQIKPSAVAEVAESVVVMDVVDHFVDHQYDLLHTQATRQASAHAAETANTYIAENWTEIREWLNFPRGLGVWTAAITAALTLQPIIAVGVGIVLWSLFTLLAMPLWEFGHKEGDIDASWGEARWFWKAFRPVRVFVANWIIRWAGVALCMIVAWSKGIQFDLGWLALGIFLLYDAVRTVTTANKQTIETQ